MKFQIVSARSILLRKFNFLRSRDMHIFLLFCDEGFKDFLDIFWFSVDRGQTLQVKICDTVHLFNKFVKDINNIFFWLFHSSWFFDDPFIMLQA